ncbi:Mitochondrial tRNAs modification protein [Exophiala xenobiotica]|uniref:Mitochondrial tRNAs modification protein n=1 Tax=Lithohypha guttulata TaxID=1690604 RepID=A0ABR0KAJ0_9EURO|nr:Mitochondrial tRNAs modification protein [Lithohypha guttulata]KAK5317338.1 Mitochondrial tRNAs modification protein [Exophiala xenobiotica]
MLHVNFGLRRTVKAHHVTCLRRCAVPQRNLLTLAIETSCDDTAVAILERSLHTDSTINESLSNENRTSQGARSRPTAQLLFNEKVTARNTGLGGIHPVKALESHQANLARLVSKALAYLPDAASTTTPTGIPTPSAPATRAFHCSDGRLKKLPDFVSVTRGPGMRSNLACGLDTAKGLAAAWQVPLLGVHHMQAHALTPRLVYALEGQSGPAGEELSGGHTMLLHSTGLVDHKILATTRDVAIGDALDKCGRVLLPDEFKLQAKDTAFAKYLSDYAFPDQNSYDTWPVPGRRRDEITKLNNLFGWQVQSPLAGTRDLAFSFTGVATSIERLFKKRTEQPGGALDESEHLLFAQTALGSAFEHLASRTVIALEMLQSAKQDVSTLVVSGGVAANSFLRYFLRKMLDVRGFEHVELLFPPVWLCTDNAAMIAWCGLEMFEAGYRSDFEVGALRKWSMDSAAADGGILGVDGWKKN